MVNRSGPAPLPACAAHLAHGAQVVGDTHAGDSLDSGLAPSAMALSGPGSAPHSQTVGGASSGDMRRASEVEQRVGSVDAGSQSGRISTPNARRMQSAISVTEGHAAATAMTARLL